MAIYRLKLKIKKAKERVFKSLYFSINKFKGNKSSFDYFSLLAF